jgi:predicted O-linked N-acetylglucosamine transferase (SPINDLY family)
MDCVAGMVAEGFRRYGAGQRGPAEDLLREALDLAPDHLSALHLLGNIAYEAGRPGEAERYLRRALDSAPANAPLHNSLAAVLELLGRFEEAELHCRKALGLVPGDPAALNNLGIVLAHQCRNSEAEALFRQALRSIPDDPELLSNLAAALNRQGRLDEAVACGRRALEFRSDFAQARVNLSNALLEQGQTAEALALLEELARGPAGSPAAYTNWGDALQLAGQLDRALDAYRRALRLAPEFGLAHLGMGHALLAQARFSEAAESLGRALRARPGDECVHNGLGSVHLCNGDLDEAVAGYQRALLLKPGLGYIRHNLGVAYLGQGRLDDARACFRESVKSQPDQAVFHDSYAGACLYDPQATPQFILSEHRAWAERHAPGAGVFRHWDNTTDPVRPLRVGYVSPDFRSHAVAYFVRPILRGHDRTQVETVCYSDVPAPDAVTVELRGLAHHWRDVYGMPTDRLAAMIRSDRIDILVELTGHTAWNRLPLMARKPAPVQVSCLGYPATTGLPQVDYRLGDTVTDPPGEPGAYAEELVRLPGCFCCYGATPGAPAVVGLPAQWSGRVTFGSLHRLAKLNGPVLDLWAEILAEVPSSRLLVSRNTLRGEAARRLREEFRRRRVADERVEFRNTQSVNLRHLGAYHDIDIALDAFPWNGHTTACEALWMGVPVVALRGDRHSARMTASVLTATGLSDWIAESREEYVEIAVRRARDVSGLATLRAGMRDRIAASPLCDAAAFTRALEDAYRLMWRRWCAGRPAVAHAGRNGSDGEPPNGCGVAPNNGHGVSRAVAERGQENAVMAHGPLIPA